METIRLLMSTDTRRNEIRAVRTEHIGLDTAEICIVDGEWESIRAWTGLHGVHKHDTRHCFACPYW